MASLLDSLVAGVQIDTTWGPPVVIADPFSPVPTPSGPGAFLKPKITFQFRDGSSQAITPYGDPGETKWPFLLTALAALGVVSAWWYLSRRR